MLTLSQINIYPVKSLDGYSPARAVVERQGLQHDRRWMLVDDQGVFLTQRTVANMAFLRAEIIENQLLKIYEKQSPQHALTLPIEAIDATRLPLDVQIWDDVVRAQPVSAEADAWLTAFLGRPCQLVKMADNTERRVDEDYNTGQDIVSFADGYPFLIIGEASLADLNQRVGTPLSMRRFRTNFVFSGGTPFQEDNFQRFLIGEVAFLGVKKSYIVISKVILLWSFLLISLLLC